MEVISFPPTLVVWTSHEGREQSWPVLLWPVCLYVASFQGSEINRDVPKWKLHGVVGIRNWEMWSVKKSLTENQILNIKLLFPKPECSRLKEALLIKCYYFLVIDAVIITVTFCHMSTQLWSHTSFCWCGSGQTGLGWIPHSVTSQLWDLK